MSKIVFHLNGLEQGGAERVVTNLSAQFAKDGNEVLIATEWQADNEFILDSRVKRVHVGLSADDEMKSRMAKYWIRIRNLKKLLLEENPDILIAFAHKANYRALMATLRLPIPVLISVRADPVRLYNSKANRLLVRWLFPHAAGCVFQSEGARNFFAQGIREKSRIILNPIHDTYIGRKPIQIRKKEIVHAGRLVGFKNQLLLLRAFAEVHEKYPAYILKLFGADSLDGTKEILEDYIHKKHLEESILLMGASDDLPSKMEQAAFFAFTSNWEGLPNALMEAMALGLPVIATDCPCGGPKTLIESGVNGVLIPVDDQHALEKAMYQMIEEPDSAERMGKEARKLGEKANAEVIYQQWKAYAADICGGKNKENREGQQ